MVQSFDLYEVIAWLPDLTWRLFEATGMSPTPELVAIRARISASTV
jgi:hypothetical protein